MVATYCEHCRLRIAPYEKKAEKNGKDYHAACLKKIECKK